MEIERVPEAYFKLPDGSELYKMNEIDKENVSITEVGNSGVIIYDTRISRVAVGNKFDKLKLLESTQEEFENKYHEIKDKTEIQDEKT